jgi:flap endonuclease-1
MTGMLSMIVKMINNNIQPVFVFDGAPPELKQHELNKRIEKYKSDNKYLFAAIEQKNKQSTEKYAKRTRRVTMEQQEEARKIVEMIGLPYVQSPGEGEAQCSILAKLGLVDAVGTDDTDALVFGGPVMIRGLESLDTDEVKLRSYNLEKLLNGWNVTMDQFIDICILCGCDYSEKIKGVGPKKAFDFIKRFGNIEAVVRYIGKDPSYTIPENFLEGVEKARHGFREPKVNPVETIVLEKKDPDFDSLCHFLFVEKQLGTRRVLALVDSLMSMLEKTKKRKVDSILDQEIEKSKKTKVDGQDFNITN